MNDTDGSSSDGRRSRRRQSKPHAADDAAELNQPSPKKLKPATDINHFKQLPPELLKAILTLLDCRQLYVVRAGTTVHSCSMCIDSRSVHSGKVHFPYIISSTNTYVANILHSCSFVSISHSEKEICYDNHNFTENESERLRALSTLFNK